MHFGIDKNRWIYRQSFLIKAVVFFFIFSVASLIANVITSYLFDDLVLWGQPASDLRQLLIQSFGGSLAWSLGVAYFTDKNRKEKAGKATRK